MSFFRKMINLSGIETGVDGGGGGTGVHGSLGD